MTGTAETRSWPDISGRIEDGRHLLAVRVYYEDTDFSGIVYHANYLKFMERGRSDFLRLIGVHHHELAGVEATPDVAFVVRRMEIDFRSPARIDDILTVTTSPGEIRGARFFLDQTVSRGGTILVAATVMAAAIARSGRPVRLPATLREKLGPRS